jgi:hypothetical protein
MRLAPILMLALMTVSCGENGGSTPSSIQSSDRFYITFSQPSGLFVVPSDNLAAAPVSVTSGPISWLSLANQFSISSAGKVTGFSPSSAMYVAGQPAHVYGVSLTETSSAPVPRQISNLTLSSLAAVCYVWSEQSNLLDPSTQFLIMHIAGAGGCGTSGDSFQVIHSTDSASTAPQTIAAKPANIIPVYQPGGALGGLVILDGSQLSFCAGSDLTAPVPLVQDVSALSTLYTDYGVSLISPSQNKGRSSASGRLAPGVIFLELTLTSGTTSYVYRIDASGDGTYVYTVKGQLGDAGLDTVIDDHNMYFVDVGGGGSGIDVFLQAPLAAGTATAMFRGSLPGYYFMLGTDNRSLLLDYYNPVSILALPIDSLSSSPSTVVSGEAADPLIGPPGDLSASVLLTGTLAANGNITATGVHSTDGTVLQPNLADSEWVLNATPDGHALQARSVTAASGPTMVSYDSATNTFDTRPFTSADGSVLQFAPSDILGKVISSNIIEAATSHGPVYFDLKKRVFASPVLP